MDRRGETGGPAVIVADTSLIASLLLPGPNNGIAEKVLRKDPEWVAPGLWRYEFMNVLATQVRVAGAPVDNAISYFEKAEEIVLPGPVEAPAAEVLRLAAERRLTAYDAQFLAMALTLDVTLVTFDRAIVAASGGRAVSPLSFAS